MFARKKNCDPFLQRRPAKPELRWCSRNLCDSCGFSLRMLVEHCVLMWGCPEQAVTFVETQDVASRVRFPEGELH
jgi:ferredoxin